MTRRLLTVFSSALCNGSCGYMNPDPLFELVFGQSLEVFGLFEMSAITHVNNAYLQPHLNRLVSSLITSILSLTSAILAIISWLST